MIGWAEESGGRRGNKILKRHKIVLYGDSILRQKS
jgi:hypothetical protein